MADYQGLRALFINCTLKRSPEKSHTQGLVDRSAAIMEKNGVEVDQLRAIDHPIATGVWPPAPPCSTTRASTPSTDGPAAA